MSIYDVLMWIWRMKRRERGRFVDRFLGVLKGEEEYTSTTTAGYTTGVSLVVERMT